MWLRVFDFCTGEEIGTCCAINSVHWNYKFELTSLLRLFAYVENLSRHPTRQIMYWMDFLLGLLPAYWTFERITCGSDYYLNVALKSRLLLSSRYSSSFACSSFFCFCSKGQRKFKSTRHFHVSNSYPKTVFKSAKWCCYVLKVRCFQLGSAHSILVFRKTETEKRSTLPYMQFYPRMPLRINATALVQHATRVTTVQSTVFASHPEGSRMHQDLRMEPLEYGKQGPQP